MAASDPSLWLSALCRESWDLAKQSLRDDAYRPRIVSLDRQDVLAATDPRSGGDMTGKVLIKVYEETGEATGSVTLADKDLDTSSRWVIRVTTGRRDGNARRQCREATEIIQRILQLYRRDPHPDWHTINDVRLEQLEDFHDKQVRLIRFRLERFGEVLPEPIRRIET